MVLLETARLLLRNYKEEDFSDVMSYFSSEEVSRYEDFYPMSEAQVKKIISEWKDMDNQSYKNDDNNQPIIIQTFLYRRKKAPMIGDIVKVTVDEIKAQVAFQEQYFNSEIRI